MVNLTLDVGKRVLNSKNHSAGHLIDLAIKNLNLSWIPGKGFHYPEGCYVQYQAKDEISTDLESLKIQIQQEFDALVKQNLQVQIEFDQTQVFNGETLRTVSFAGLCPCPCGGTHVENTADLDGFEITKIKVKSDVIKISYGMSASFDIDKQAELRRENLLSKIMKK